MAAFYRPHNTSCYWPSTVAIVLNKTVNAAGLHKKVKLSQWNHSTLYFRNA